MLPINPDVSGWTKLKTQVYNSRYTATQLSPMVGIPWNRFSNAQQGRVILTPEEYERIAEILEIHPIDLVGFNDPDLVVVNVSDSKERNTRMRLERKALRNLRMVNPELYQEILDTYGSDDPHESQQPAKTTAGNGSRG